MLNLGPIKIQELFDIRDYLLTNQVDYEYWFDHSANTWFLETTPAYETLVALKFL
jgi:hypothetical protein